MVIKETKNYLDKTDEIMSISKEKAAHFNNTVANFLTISLKEAEDDGMDYAMLQLLELKRFIEES